MNKLSKIDWQLLASAYSFYENKGYEYVEVPYIVPMPEIKLTFPKTDNSHKLSNLREGLIGSAEQSFLYLMRNNKLIQNQFYFAISPCFRDELKYNKYSQRHFIKLELFTFSAEYDSHHLQFIAHAQDFCAQILKKYASVICTDVGWDLQINGIEIGSYGFREIDNIYTFYGTGLALPRFSLATKI